MSDLIRRQDAIEAIASRDETDGTVKVFTGREVNEILSALPSAEPKMGKWISEELANMICDEICYYKEVTVDADSLKDLCEGCLIKKLKYDRPTGEWVEKDGECVCSECGNSVSFSWTEDGWVLGKFCQTCGAEMRGESSE